MPSTKQLEIYVAQTYAPKASPTFTGTVTLPSGTAISAAALTAPVLTAPSGSGFAVSETIEFIEDATSTTHTGTVVIPAGATLHDIIVSTSVLWTDASAVIDVGDAQAATGWFNQVNLAATDLLVGEALRASSPTAGWAGKPGAYLVAATGVWGQATATKAGPIYKTAGSVIGVVSVATPSGTAGRTYMTVIYSVGSARVATAA